jgi:hypothetical protein
VTLESALKVAWNQIWCIPQSYSYLTTGSTLMLSEASKATYHMKLVELCMICNIYFKYYSVWYFTVWSTHFFKTQLQIIIHHRRDTW